MKDTTWGSKHSPEPTWPHVRRITVSHDKNFIVTLLWFCRTLCRPDTTSRILEGKARVRSEPIHSAYPQRALDRLAVSMLAEALASGKRVSNVRSGSISSWSDNLWFSERYLPRECLDRWFSKTKKDWRRDEQYQIERARSSTTWVTIDSRIGRSTSYYMTTLCTKCRSLFGEHLFSLACLGRLSHARLKKPLNGASNTSIQ